MTKNAPINTDASANSQYPSISEAFERCDAPVDMKLQSLLDSPYQRHVPINRNFFPAEMNHYYHITKKDDVRTI